MTDLPVPSVCLVVLDGWGIADPGPGNAATLMAMPELDGALVGGASLEPDEFARIIQYHRG